MRLLWRPGAYGRRIRGLQLVRRESHDGRDVFRPARQGDQTVEAQSVSAARRNSPERIDESLVDGIDGQLSFGSLFLVVDEATALLGRIHQLAEAVAQLDAG